MVQGPSHGGAEWEEGRLPWKLLLETVDAGVFVVTVTAFPDAQLHITEVKSFESWKLFSRGDANAEARRWSKTALSNIVIMRGNRKSEWTANIVPELVTRIQYRHNEATGKL